MFYGFFNPVCEYFIYIYIFYYFVAYYFDISFLFPRMHHSTMDGIYPVEGKRKKTKKKTGKKYLTVVKKKI